MICIYIIDYIAWYPLCKPAIPENELKKNFADFEC